MRLRYWLAICSLSLMPLLPLPARADRASVAACLAPAPAVDLAPLQTALPNPCVGVREPTGDEIAKALEPFFMANTHEITRPLTFWHYGYRTPRFPKGAPAGVYDNSVAVPSDAAVKSPTPTDADYSGPVDPRRDARAYFTRKIDGHLKSDKQESSWGSGLYSAADPLSSVSFAHDALLRIRVPAGMRYLDLRGADGKAIPATPEIRREILCSLYRRDFGSADSWAPEQIERIAAWLGDSVSGMGAQVKVNDLLGIAAGREALGSLYSRHGISFWLARFATQSYAACADANGNAEGFQAIFVDSANALPKSALDILVPELETRPSPAKRALYEEASAYFEAFEESECGRLSTGGSGPALCVSWPGAKESFWKLYRGWATALYGVKDDLPQAELEAFRRKRHDEMPPETRKKLLAASFGCAKGD